jgi:hypothetical protein
MVTGCGDASAPSDSIASNGDSLASGPSGNSREQHVSSPSDTVARFYEALRGGEEDTIANLLTDKARTETAKAGLDIQSQGSADLEYQLGEVDYINESLDGAHVKSLWIDYTPEGDKVATEVIWVLRKQAEGWRIAGMATQVAEGQLPLLFNFENPQDMLQKKEFLESQYGQADEAEVQQTASPEGPVVPDELVR